MSETLRRPEQILSELSSDRLNLIEKVKIEIIAALEDRFTGDPIDVYVSGRKNLYEAVLPQIKRFCAAAGWFINIKNVSDAADETWFEVTPEDYLFSA